MNMRRLLSTPTCLSLLALLVLVTPNRAAELKTVKARSLELKVPASWKSKPATSMRAAQFGIPAKKPGQDGGEFVVFYFGGPTGGIRANVQRWVGQFHAEGRKVEMRQGECAAGSYISIDISGTWKKPIGPPFARKSVDAPNSRVINVIVIEEMGDKRDYYFLKMSGPQDLVKSQADAWQVAIGAKKGSERPFKLEDAAN